jgi:hypothetical protein
MNLRPYLARLITILYPLSWLVVAVVWALWLWEGGGFEAIYVLVVTIPASLWVLRRQLLETEDSPTAAVVADPLQNPPPETYQVCRFS